MRGTQRREKRIVAIRRRISTTPKLIMSSSQIPATSSSSKHRFRSKRLVTSNLLCLVLLLFLGAGTLLTVCPANSLHASAMLQAPSTCPNLYDSTITSFKVLYGGRTFDVLDNQSSVISVPVGASYNVSFVLQTVNTSTDGNTLNGSTWFSYDALGFSAGQCVYGNNEFGAGYYVGAVYGNNHVLINFEVSLSSESNVAYLFASGGNQSVEFNSEAPANSTSYAEFTIDWIAPQQTTTTMASSSTIESSSSATTENTTNESTTTNVSLPDVSDSQTTTTSFFLSSSLTTITTSGEQTTSAKEATQSTTTATTTGLTASSFTPPSSADSTTFSDTSSSPYPATTSPATAPAQQSLKSAPFGIFETPLIVGLLAIPVFGIAWFVHEKRAK